MDMGQGFETSGCCDRTGSRARGPFCEGCSAGQISGSAGSARSTQKLETAAAKPEFAVASIKQSGPDVSTKGTDFLSPFHVDLPERGRFSANALLFVYIGFAYKIVDTSQYRRLQDSLPNWAQTQQFDIEARAEGAPATDEVRLMMQSLLESRFKAAIHSEIRQLPVFALVLNDPGRLGL
jgi:hypothetical protein